MFIGKTCENSDYGDTGWFNSCRAPSYEGCKEDGIANKAGEHDWCGPPGGGCQTVVNAMAADGHHSRMGCCNYTFKPQ